MALHVCIEFRSLPHWLDKIREPATQAKPQARGGDEEKDTLSVIHSHLDRAN